MSSSSSAAFDTSAVGICVSRGVTDDFSEEDVRKVVLEHLARKIEVGRGDVYETTDHRRLWVCRDTGDDEPPMVTVCTLLER
jgi:hypothetical protein